MLHRLSMALVLLFLFAFAPGEASRAAEKRPPVEPKRSRHALLIGVTDYPSLARRLRLDGGANDVLLMKRLLMEKYAFDEANITILSEAEGAKNPTRLPIKANIERACKELAAKTPEGGQALLLMTGHGSRQPEKDGVKDPQPDGFDKIFLPRDVRGFAMQEESVPNAISGRELGAWLRPLPQKKAALWVIVDACHSGTMVRGGKEKARQLSPERDLNIPAKMIEAAEARARKAGGEKTRGGDGLAASRGPMAREDGVVLTYACLSRQVTYEGRYKDPYTGEAKPFGLLTHTIAGLLLAANENLSYRELATRILNAYKRDDRDEPTPVIEGAAQTRTVLGESAVSRFGFVLTSRADRLVVNAGQLHGLTRGSILAVHPPAGVKSAVRGYVKVGKITPVRCEVEPIEYSGKKAPAPKELLDGRCEVVEISYSDLKLKVAVDRLGAKATKEELDQCARVVESLAKKADSPVEFLADQGEAEWLVRKVGEQVFLLPASEWEDQRPVKERRQLGPAPSGEALAPWLQKAFSRIVHALNLVRLASRPVDERIRGADAGDFAARVTLEVERVGGKPPAKGVAETVKTFYHGDDVRFRITNPGQIPVDVTVLYVNSKFGVEPLFPTAKGGELNRVESGKTITLPIVEVDTKTAGRENIVVIAVKSQGEDLTDFAALSQASIEGVKKAVQTRTRSARGMGSPLGALMQKALYGQGSTPRMKPKDVQDFSAAVVSVQIIAGKRPR